MKTDHPKIDIYWKRKSEPANAWRYAVSTTWFRTCREAAANYQPTGPSIDWEVKGRFAESGK